MSSLNNFVNRANVVTIPIYDGYVVEKKDIYK